MASIHLSVDGIVYHFVANSSAIPFNHNFFLILNLATFGTFGGPVDPAFDNARMELDYISVSKY